MYSRQNPSPRYQELVALYRHLHEEGEKALGLPPESTFIGKALRQHVPHIRKLILMTGAKTILDYGSGKGMLYQKPVMLDGIGEIPSIKDFWGVDSVTCYDPAYKPNSTLPTGQFDGVVCTDVLEHCPEQDIEWILGELFSYARQFVYATVSCIPARKTLPNGENAHCTVQPPQRWQPLITKIAARYPQVKFVFLLNHVHTPAQGAPYVRDATLMNFDAQLLAS